MQNIIINLILKYSETFYSKNVDPMLVHSIISELQELQKQLNLK
jgi:hypothetical protein